MAQSKLALALSGGGFRATLFHLGAIRALREHGVLQDVGTITAVSGGSILAAHLALHWRRYTGTNEEFEAVSREVLDFVRRDVRGRIVRRWLLGVVPRRLLACLPKGVLRKFPASLRPEYLSRTKLAENEYARLYTVREGTSLRAAQLGDLKGGPAVHFSCTSLTTGGACWFDASGFWWKAGSSLMSADASATKLAFAVAASAAFPPLFPPITVSHETLRTSVAKFTNPQQLTDGGVYDNLGVHEVLERSLVTDPADLLIVSDGEGNFDWELSSFAWLTTRSIRVSNVLMNRVSALQYSSLGSFGQRCIGVSIDSIVKAPAVAFLDSTAQRLLRNIRTDLDAFSAVEIDCLVNHGYAVASEAFATAHLGGPPEKLTPWHPLGDAGQHPRLLDALERGKQRRLRLFRPDDWAFWGLIIVCAAILLALGREVFSLVESAAQARVNGKLADDRERQWELTSQLLLWEPSDLAPTLLTDEDASPLFVAVDDDELTLSVVKVLSPATTEGPVRIGVMRSLQFDYGLRPNDLEGIAHLNGQFLAVTSHRDGSRNRRLLLQFQIDSDKWRDENFVIPVTQFTLKNLEQFAQQRVATPVVLPDGRVQGLEIEGIVHGTAPDTVLLGLKSPLRGTTAAILTVDLKRDEVVDVDFVASGGKGITAMAWVGDQLYVATNPPGTAADPPQCQDPVFGQSEILVLKKDLQPTGRTYAAEARFSCGKLEGMAPWGGLLFLAYEGAKPHFKAISLSK